MISVFPFQAEKYYLTEADTLIRDEYDASNLFLSFKFKFIEGDTLASSRLMNEQMNFLHKMRLPSSGLDQVNNNEYKNLTLLNLDEKYNCEIQELNGHEYKDLYRQICSQIIIKKICGESKYLPGNGKLINTLEFYIDEMKESGGINIALIYAALLKLQSQKSTVEFCAKMNQIIPYSESILRDNESQLKEIKMGYAQFSNPIDKFIMENQEQRITSDKEYLKKMKNISCSLCE